MSKLPYVNQPMGLVLSVWKERWRGAVQNALKPILPTRRMEPAKTVEKGTDLCYNKRKKVGGP